MTNVNSLQSVLKFLGTKAKSYEDVGYEPTFKSSAIFPIMCGGGLSAKISFMNYWKYKNGIEPVSCLMTVRSQSGDTLHRSYFKVEEDVYCFAFPELVREHLDERGRFIGSCEFEIYSIEDLKFPYPALSLFYETPKGVSAVHMASRVFHSIGDMDKRFMSDVQESGFDIYADETWTPFVAFTNGPREVKDGRMSFSAYNAAGETEVIELQCGDLNAYQTLYVFPDERYELKEFLKDKVGFCKVKYDSFGIFPRLLCGNVARDRSHIAITHSYYDVSGREEYFRADSAANTRGSFRAIPLLFDEQLDLDLNFYPIYSPSVLELRARVYDRDGELLADLDRLGSIQSPSNVMANLRIRDMLQRAEIPLERCSLLSIECAAQGGDIPTRINYGVNYHKASRIGTNINISMHQDAEYRSPNRSYRWLPIYVRGGHRTHVVLSVLGNGLGDDFEAEVKISIFGRRGLIYSDNVCLRNQTCKSLGVEDMLGQVDRENLDGQVLWCTLESECPYVDAYYLIVSDQGYVGGDHSF